MHTEFNGREYDLNKHNSTQLLLAALAQAVMDLRDYFARLHERIRELEQDYKDHTHPEELP